MFVNGFRSRLVLPTVALAAAFLMQGAAHAKPPASEHGSGPSALAGRSAIYGGGPFYAGGQAVMNTLRSSGFTTVVLWTIHVNATNGDLIFNDIRIVSGGKYVG